MFDIITNSGERYEGHLIYHDDSSNSSMYIFLQSMNQKLYNNSVSFMEPTLYQSMLSLGFSTNRVTFPTREMVSHSTTQNIIPPIYLTF